MTTFEAKSTLRSWMACSERSLAGDYSGAAGYAREAAASMDWTKLTPVLTRGQWHVYALAELSGGQVYVDHARHVIATSRTMWTTLECYGPAQNTFLEQMTSGSNGMKFLTTDAGHYAEAARRSILGMPGLVSESDPLKEAEAKVATLLTQARDLTVAQRPATDGQVDMFTRRLLEVTGDVEALEAAVARIRSGVELAREAVLAL